MICTFISYWDPSYFTTIIPLWVVSRLDFRISERSSAILGGFGKSQTTVWAGKSVWNGLGLLSCNEPYPPNPTVNWISPLLNLKHARPHLQYSAFCLLSLSHILKLSHSHSRNMELGIQKQIINGKRTKRKRSQSSPIPISSSMTDFSSSRDVGGGCGDNYVNTAAATTTSWS